MSRHVLVGRFVLVFGVCLSIATSACGAILSHVGDVDPESEGWSENNMTQAGNSGSAVAGPAWQIVDGNTSESAFYSNTFSLAELPTDWVQTVQVSVSSASANNAVFSAVTDAATLFYFFYSPTALFYGESTNINPTHIFNVDNTTFHTYSFAYDSALDQIDISLDGNYQTSLARSAFFQNPGTSANQYFGSPSSGNTSVSAWGLVTLAPIPEPSSLCLLACGIAGVARLHRRRGA